MGIIALQEMSEAEVQATKEPDPNKGKIVYSLAAADRPYDSDEKEAEERAIKFSHPQFKRIPPIYGTLGYLFRNLAGGKNRNDVVVQCLREASFTNKSKWLKNLLILWETFDEYSKHRVDIFDWFCKREEIPISKFWGVYQEGAFSFDDALTKSAIQASQQELIHTVRAHMRKEKNFNDRKLMAEMGGLVKDAPLINVQDNSKTTNNTAVIIEGKAKLPAFVDSIRRSEKKVESSVNEDKLLTEGDTDYIDAEIVEKEKEPILVQRRTISKQKEANL